MSLDRLALLYDPAHEVLNLRADSKFRSGQGSGKQEIETIWSWTTLLKKKTKFSSYKEIQMGSVAKSYMRKGILIYEEMRKYLTIYEEAVSHI